MEPFNFEEFERNIPKFADLLKAQMQRRLFTAPAPDFEVKVQVFDNGKGYGKRISVETSDIAEHMNFSMFGEVSIHDFGGGTMKTDPWYWLPIDWQWSNKGNGGSNGTRAFTCYVSDSGGIVKINDL